MLRATGRPGGRTAERDGNADGGYVVPMFVRVPGGGVAMLPAYPAGMPASTVQAHDLFAFQTVANQPPYRLRPVLAVLLG